MMSSRAFEGKNVEMAVKAACEALSISKDKLKYKIVSHGSTGIFGLVGIKKAKISVALPEPEPEINREKAAEDPAADRGDDPGDAGPDRHAGGATALEVSDNSAGDHREDTVPRAADAAAIGLEALEKITNAITSGAKISIEENNGRMLFNIEGGNAGLMIGKRGQTLEAIQYLVEKIVNKKHENRVRVHVDVEKYLENRRTNLQDLAVRMAEKAKKTGKPSTIGQMNAHDRRIVHMTLKDDKQVRTQSMGDGYLRKLLIFPKKGAPKRKPS